MSKYVKTIKMYISIEGMDIFSYDYSENLHDLHVNVFYVDALSKSKKEEWVFVITNENEPKLISKKRVK